MEASQDRAYVGRRFLLERSWEVFWKPRRRLGASWRRLGASWGVLGTSWDVLVRLGGVVGRLGDVFGAFWGVESISICFCWFYIFK